MTDYIVLYMTCASKEEARDITKALIEKRLIACANIMTPHETIYHWQGKIETGSEVAVIMKSRAVLFSEIEKIVIKQHSYETPCLVAWPLTQGHGPFVSWLEEETTQTDEPGE